MKGISENQIQQIRTTLQKYLASDLLEAHLFGSRISGEAAESSDLDILLKGKTAVSLAKMALLKEEFENSSLPFRVDVIDNEGISDEFRAKILRSSIRLI